jgi:hypothetical protein
MAQSSFQLVNVFATTLDAGQEQTARSQARVGRTIRFLSLGIRLAFFAVFGVALWCFWCFWWAGLAGHHQDWSYFWDIGSILVMLSTAWGFLDWVTIEARWAYSQSLALRRVALAGDDRLAPQVSEQPSPLPSA